MRLGILLSLSLAMAVTGFGQSNSPPQFLPYYGPTAVYPDTTVIFAVEARDPEFDPVDYALLSSPTNVLFDVFFDRGYNALLIWDIPSRAAVGTTNHFVLRATDYRSPPLSTTNTIALVVIAPPPIRSLQISNALPVLHMDNLQPDKAYLVEWTAALPTASWNLLTVLPRTNPRPPVVSVTDTNPPATQRFYRLRPSGSECYTFICP